METRPKPRKPDTPVPALAGKPQHTISLEQVAHVKGVFHATVNGKRVVVCFHERDRSSAKARFNSITLRPARVDAAKAMAKTEALPLLIGVQVRVCNKWDSGWLIRSESFNKNKHGESDFALSAIARAAYAADKNGLVGVRFTLEVKQHC